MFPVLVITAPRKFCILMLSLPSFRILALALLITVQLVAATSPVSIDLYPLEDGEALLDVVPRSRGGVYLVVGKRAPETVTGGISTELPDPEYSSTSGFLVGGYYVASIRRLDEIQKEVGRIDFPAESKAFHIRAVAATDGGLVLLCNSPYGSVPVVEPLFPIPPPMPGPESDIPSYGYLLRTNANGTGILRATLLGGTVRTFRSNGTRAWDLTRDGAGNLYVTGGTGHVDFPITPGAAKSDPGFSSPGKREEGFLMKISGDLRRLFFSTFLGSDEQLPTSCGPIQFPASSQIGRHRSAGYAVRVNSQQQAVVCTATNGRPIPTTDGAYRAVDPSNTQYCQEPFGVRNLPFGFPQSFSLLRFDTAGSRIVSSAYLGRGRNSAPYSGSAAMQLLPDGGAVALVFAAESTAQTYPLRLMKLNAALSILEAEQNLITGLSPVIPVGTTSQSDASFWLVGRLWPHYSIPTEGLAGLQPSVNLGPDVLMSFRASDLQPAGLWMLPNGATSAGIRNALGEVDVISASGSRLRIPLLGSLSPTVLGTANAAGLSVKSTVSPYEFLSLYGDDLGPSAGSSTSFNNRGDLPTLHQNVRVWIDGIAAPLLYVSNSQINLIAPEQLANRASGARVLLEVERDGAIIATVPMRTAASDVHAFRHSDPQRFSDVIVVNQDGTLNSTTNLAARGEVVTLYLNGGGAAQDRFPAGRRVPSASPFSSLTPVMTSMRDSFLPTPQPPPMVTWPVEYFGAAPTLAAGTLQLNLRIPPEIAFRGVGATFATLQFTAADADPEDEPVAPPINVIIFLKP